MFDDDENNTSSSDSSENEPAPSGEASSETIEGSEPPPAGDDTEPAPAGESSSSDDPSDKPLEDNEGHSDSSAETDSGGSSDSSSSSSAGSSSSSDSGSSSSGDSSSGGQSVQPPSADDVAGALTHAFQDHNVPMDDDTVNVTFDTGLYKFAARLSSSFNPLPQVHDDTQSLQTGSVQGAMYLVQGAVQIIEDQVRVSMRIVSVETSAILQASSGDGSGSVLDAITGAAGDALAGLPALNAS
jgi:hypothetical protein